MKSRLLAVHGLLVLLFWGTGAEAKCRPDGVNAFPSPGSVVPTNARFILEGWGAEQAGLAQLVGKTVVLRSDASEIKAKVMKGWTSLRFRTAVVVVPTQELAPGASYVLSLNGALGIAFGGRLVWQTGQERDDRPPKFQLNPSVAEGQHYERDGELHRNLKIHTTLNEDSPAYLVVTLARLKGKGAAQKYFVPLDGGTALLGHDGCSGSFFFDAPKYRMTIEAFDVSGNAGPKLRPMDVQSPRRAGR